ncbi:MAG: hypothetical protein H6765_10370 [Candidatus Peribacteria bacterium]|nr:MAG: hypothetical protein H6765_10370 [Candidatus Peribacteria bacterium]
MDYLEKNPDVGLIGTNMIIVDEHGRETRRVVMRETDTAIRNHLMLSNQFAHPSVVIRRSTLEQVGSYDEQFTVAQDGDLWMRI